MSAGYDAAGNPDGTRNMNPAGIGFWALVAEDYRTHGRDPLSQGFWALFWHRFGNWRMAVPRPWRAPLSLIYRLMFKFSQIFCGIEAPYSIPIGRRVHFEHFGGVVLSARGIGDDVILRQNVTLGIAHLERPQDRPLIGDRVQIGAGAAILGRIEVGADAVVGANAVVVRDVPPGMQAVGVPARIRPRRGFGAADDPAS
ncbi:MAG: serine O-acetyltransferase [Albimonas sp.]|uniref:serine O-acetyltransferase n=1 Tax=Albimonas sp. TaxID=1872425 RepID=UPI004055BDA3|tara:strand:- start:260 stop:856 length:597 start_codon:yes stop_codon:yes gene_type:complete